MQTLLINCSHTGELFKYVESAINYITDVIKVITNMRSTKASKLTVQQTKMVEALFDVYLVADLQNDEKSRELFKDYQGYYMLMNVESPIAKDLLSIYEVLDEHKFSEKVNNYKNAN